MSKDFEAAVSEPVIVVSPVTASVEPSNRKFSSPFMVPDVPVAVNT